MSSQSPKRSAWAKGPPSPHVQSPLRSVTTASGPPVCAPDFSHKSLSLLASPSHLQVPPPPLPPPPQGVCASAGYYMDAQYHPGLPMYPTYDPYKILPSGPWTPQNFPPQPPPQLPGVPIPGPLMSRRAHQLPPDLWRPPGLGPQESHSQVRPGGGLAGVGSPGVPNTLAPKRIVIKSESGEVLDLEKWRKQVPPPRRVTAPRIEGHIAGALAMKEKREGKGARRARRKAEKARCAAEAKARAREKKKLMRREDGEEEAESRDADEGRAELKEVDGGEEGLWKNIEWDWGSDSEQGVEQSWAPQEAEGKAEVRVSATGSGQGSEVELSEAEVEGLDWAIDHPVNEDQYTASELNTPLRTPFTWAEIKRRPARHDLQEAKDWRGLEVASSARTHIDLIQYPIGVERPKESLDVNAVPGKFNYDQDFLLQPRSVCKDKPDALLPLEEIGIAPVAQRSTSSCLQDPCSSPPAASRNPSLGYHSFGHLKSSASPSTMTVGSGTTLPSWSPSKSVDLSMFGKIDKPAPMTLVPSSVFQQNDIST